MKKLNLLSLLIAIFALASCSSDNDDKTTNLANDVIGSYTGYTSASTNYFQNMVAANETVNITSTEVNKVNISFVSATWGTITINGADLTGSEGNVIIKGAGKSLMAHAGNAPQEYDCNVEGKFTNNNLELIFSCPTVMSGLKIEFKEGEVPADLVVPGTYKGYTIAQSSYFNGMTAENQSIVISKNDNGTFKVAYTSDTWGEFLIQEATATYENGKFIVKGNGTTKMGMNGNVNEYACEIEGTVDVAKADPTFTFSVPTVMGGLSITFHNGELPATE